MKKAFSKRFKRNAKQIRKKKIEEFTESLEELIGNMYSQYDNIGYYLKNEKIRNKFKKTLEEVL